MDKQSKKEHDAEFERRLKAAGGNIFRAAKEVNGQAPEYAAQAMLAMFADTLRQFMEAYPKGEFGDPLARERISALGITVADHRDYFDANWDIEKGVVGALRSLLGNPEAEVTVLGVPPEGLPDDLKRQLRDLGIPEDLIRGASEPQKGGGDGSN